MALACLLALLGIALPTSAVAQLSNTCSAATVQGTAPADFQGYCWLDMTGYVDATARSAGGQAFGWNLPDGTRVTATVRATNNAVAAVASPAWTGSAFGNTNPPTAINGGFGGIAGRPVLYTTGTGIASVTLSSITVTPPAGVGASAYMFVVGDAESTDGAEYIAMTTNGGAWTLLDLLDASGPTPPATPSNGGLTMTINGNGGGSPGDDYIFGTTSPTQVSVSLNAGGLQGVAFAVRFASIRLNKQILSTRINAADQFTYRITSTTGGATLATGTTTGTGNGPFTAASLSLASGQAMTLTETMAAGSSSALSSYVARLTCTNSTTGSSTPLPNNVLVSTAGTTASYNFGSLQYGDAVVCTFTNIAQPRLTLTKALGGTRVFTGDQFTMNLSTGATTVATTTTTGTGATIATGTTPQYLGAVGTAYSFNEVAAGTTNLTYYTSGMACTNAYTASTTTLPTAVGGSVTPVLGDNITCTITNTPKPNRANLTIVKSMTLVSDPVNGASNPKLIPGAIVDYDITVTNAGTGPVDLSTVVINDPIPANLATFVGANAVTFINGTPSSGLSFTYPTNVTWTRTGGLPLVPDAAGYDSAVTNVRIAPTGVMPAATATGQPTFTVRFRARIN
jgi:Surface adhesin CshA non-repetitive domain 2